MTLNGKKMGLANGSAAARSHSTLTLSEIKPQICQNCPAPPTSFYSEIRRQQKLPIAKFICLKG